MVLTPYRAGPAAKETKGNAPPADEAGESMLSALMGM